MLMGDLENAGQYILDADPSSWKWKRERVQIASCSQVLSLELSCHLYH